MNETILVHVMVTRKKQTRPTKPPKEVDITLRVEFRGTKGDVGERLLNWLLSVGADTMPEDFDLVKIQRVGETDWSKIKASAYKRSLKEQEKEWAEEREARQERKKKNVVTEVPKEEQFRRPRRKIRRKKS